ncbi:hypothetical protein [Sphingomonas solaris]|uniref:EexN family lipoprotein n=1 Tax=Alterirhizorhabdus solaris TaxID=2529389 RepID=A0A558R3X1_9SPHN|nr:hypothetical protein [Sphingomonas solaris]TVV74042.1 hypothetical protein FOY91_10805 [Sphingomonas solaris]
MSGRVRIACLLPVTLSLAGCTTTPPPVAAPVAVPASVPAAPPAARPSAIPHVEVRRCPTVADIARLRESRPKPLRDQKMPATSSERVARTAAQLGQYEAQGQWADQVERAFRKCEDR